MEESRSPQRRRCIVYIDGFNFYFGIFAQKPDWKWLNIQSFFETLRTREDVVSIKYFTAIIDPKKLVSDRRNRQALYLEALGTLPKVKIIKGVFQPRRRRCEGTCMEEYNVPEEKKTDVNIALNMLEDCLSGKTDSIVLVSGDSDQEPAIAWIHRRFPQLKITVYVPVLANEKDERRNDFYHEIGVPCYPLPLDAIPYHQFPTAVKVGFAKFVQRPAEWV